MCSVAKKMCYLAYCYHALQKVINTLKKVRKTWDSDDAAILNAKKVLIPPLITGEPISVNVMIALLFLSGSWVTRNVWAIWAAWSIHNPTAMTRVMQVVIFMVIPQKCMKPPTSTRVNRTQTNTIRQDWKIKWKIIDSWS